MQRFKEWLQWKRTWRQIKKAMRRNQRNGIGTTSIYFDGNKITGVK